MSLVGGAFPPWQSPLLSIYFLDAASVLKHAYFVCRMPNQDQRANQGKLDVGPLDNPNGDWDGAEEDQAVVRSFRKDSLLSLAQSLMPRLQVHLYE
jgi:hypothetical protein